MLRDLPSKRLENFTLHLYDLLAREVSITKVGKTRWPEHLPPRRVDLGGNEEAGHDRKGP